MCGSYGIMNKKATPLQLSLYCSYQNLVNESHLNQMWPSLATQYHCSTESVDCLPVQFLSYNQACPPGASTKHTENGTFCCKMGTSA